MGRQAVQPSRLAALPFPRSLRLRPLFAWPDETLANRTLNTPPGVAAGSAVSTPELAVLELLYDVGTHEDIEEARNLFEGIRNLRVDLVGCLLGCCTSVKQSDCS